MTDRSEKLGELNCRVVSRLPAGTPPKLVVVLCHGFGAPGTDLVPIGAELLDHQPQLANNIEIVFPAAPLSLDHLGYFGGRAWWPIDMEELVGAVERGELRILRDQRPQGMSEARDMLLSTIQEIQRRTGLPNSQIVLGGFSQGSMLAVDAAINLSTPPAALCLWSSTLVSETHWRAKAAGLKGVPVLQSHGRQDQILPFAASLWLRDLLVEVGAKMDFIEFKGPHTIPMAAMERFVEQLQSLVAKATD